jgi:hypothetical protein
MVVIASETGWGTSRAATQEMSPATYHTLSKPAPKGQTTGPK